MFALVYERDPLSVQDLPAATFSWIQDAGGFAAVGLVIYLLYCVVQRQRLLAWSPHPILSALFILALVGAALSYGALFATWLPDLLRMISESSRPALPPTSLLFIVQASLLTAGGACALIAAGLPFLVGLTRLRPRRIWALAKLSFKEALRRRILWAFAALLLVFLFAGWFIQTRPADQVRTYVGVVSLVTTVLLLVTAGLLAAFSIPGDIRHQTIHTILTKPVERFEIVLGRFLGYVLLMTLVLVAATAFSLIYTLRGVDPAAAEESFKARVPLYGELLFEGTTDARKGESVGREWDYRGYISGPSPPSPTQYAIWSFTSPPRKIPGRDTVRCEFTFDIFRTTKGRDNTPVSCTLEFETWRFDPTKQEEFNNERNQRRKSETLDELDADLAKKYGYYRKASVPIEDYKTLFVDIPAALVENAREIDATRRQQLESAGKEFVPLRVKVRCEDRTQYLGMAKYDLYFRLDDHEAGSDDLWFSWNFFKGAAGLWFRLCLVIGLATALSTYLSGVISFLTTAFLIVAGMFQEFIQKLATGQNFGGGPMESMFRLLKGTSQAAQLDDTAAARVAAKSDLMFRWVLRRLLNVLPDFDLFGLTDRVAEGFNVSAGELGIRLLFLVGYLLPWAVLGYYLMRAREVASSS